MEGGAGGLSFLCSTHHGAYRIQPSLASFSTSVGCLIKAEVHEVRVCTNRTCRKQGSLQVLETLAGLLSPSLSLKPCGCLGRCGAGPNVVLLPDGVVVSHCGTAARAAEVLFGLCCGDGARSDRDEPAKSLEALALRKRAESELEKRNFSDAVLLLSQAIELNPFGGIHIIRKDRSVARLGLGDYSGALEDAREAAALAPNYPEAPYQLLGWKRKLSKLKKAYICEGDAYLAMDHLDLAEKSYLTALQIDPSIRRSKSFKARITVLQEKLSTADLT